MRCHCIVLVVLLCALCAGSRVSARAIQVLYVGGDWKSQIPAIDGKPMRGFFVREALQKAAPGEFNLALWTSYEFLQYGDAASLGGFDVIVAGDVMGQSVTPRLVEALERFVRGGGGFWYCDNHKAFSFNTVEKSFDPVLPIEVVPFRPYDDNGGQPMLKGAVRVTAAAPKHPILSGLDLAAAPALRGARHGKVKPGAVVLAKAAAGEPIWVARELGEGRSLWTGGVFASDEQSVDFANWAQFGQFYAQALRWLGERSRAPDEPLASVTAAGTVTIDLDRTGPKLTSRHFGIHGQETARGARPMEGADLALYRALNLDGTFARTSAFMGIRKAPGGKPHEMMDDGTDLSSFDPSKYDFAPADEVLRDLERIKAEPLFLYWVPWKFSLPDLPDKERFTKYFAASIEHVNGKPGTPDYRPRLRYFEIMNEPNLGPISDPAMSHAQVMDAFIGFVNHSAAALSARYPGVEFGVGGFYEWSYLQRVMEACGKNLGWISRHPYGHTGEAVFDLHDEYARHADSLGLEHLKFIITEWDFWIYGEPAFDYIMQRWKPLADRADRVLGTLHYRWREYEEGGYVFGLHGEFDQKYGILPPQWPNPGKDKPITYRYNAFWAMRHARGMQHHATLNVPALEAGRSNRAWAIATSNDEQFNIVIYYGYPQPDRTKRQRAETLRLRIRSAIPPQVKGRTLVIERADARSIVESPPRPLAGDALDLELELPAQSAVSLIIR